MKMLIKYVYDKSIRNVIGEPIFMDKYKQEWIRVDRGRPIGVIVALSPDKIGWSRCDTRDHFSKRIGKDIAMDRAVKVDKGILPKRLQKDYEWMLEKVKTTRWGE